MSRSRAAWSSSPLVAMRSFREISQYARERTAFAAVAGALSLSALALLGGLTGALTRRR